MATDSSGKLPRGPRPNWVLPDILHIRFDVVRFEPRQHRHFRSALAGEEQAVELVVELSGLVPARGEGPALFIGDTLVSEGEPIDERHWRFLAFKHHALKQGAPIAWGWTDSPPEDRRPTDFRFELKG